jgi:hypothetical protein
MLREPDHLTARWSLTHQTRFGGIPDVEDLVPMLRYLNIPGSFQAHHHFSLDGQRDLRVISQDERGCVTAKG